MVLPLNEEYLRRHPLPQHESGDKHSRGRVLIIAGHRDVPGAALLAGLGALRSGAGVLRIATGRTNAPHLALAMPEAMVIGFPEGNTGEIEAGQSEQLISLADDADAVLVGPGMLDEDQVGSICKKLLQKMDGPPLLLDAAAFTALRHLDLPPEKQLRLVCTPHAGEMAKFTGIERRRILEDPLGVAQKVAKKLRAVIAMKGAETYIVSPSTKTLHNAHGTIGLATSGSGDTLAGILVGLLARGTDPFLATAWAVFLHAEAGHRLATRLGTLGLLAREIPGEIPTIMHEFAKRP
jgi:ADP-dependent NAD(P)H-hydrate dehydratase